MEASFDTFEHSHYRGYTYFYFSISNFDVYAHSGSFSAWWFREARIGAAYVPLYEVVRGNNKKVKSSFM